MSYRDSDPSVSLQNSSLREMKAAQYNFEANIVKVTKQDLDRQEINLWSYSI
jgi:hypothetical protein